MRSYDDKAASDLSLRFKDCKCRTGMLSCNGPSRPYIEYSDDCFIHKFVKKFSEELEQKYKAKQKALEKPSLLQMIAALVSTGKYHDEDGDVNRHKLVYDAREILDALDRQ